MTSVELLSLDPKTKSSKELVIHTLGNRWPLSAKEVHLSLTREQGIQSTYQATHKLLKDLEAAGVIQKENKKYRLNADWIGKSRNYFETISMAYENKDAVIHEEKTVIFNNFTDLSLALGNMVNSGKFTGQKYVDVYAISRHLYWPLKFNFKDFELCLSVGKSARPHLICKENSPFDKLIRKYYLIAEWPDVIIGADIDVVDDIVVQGHTIMQIKYSDATKKKLDEIYSKVSNLADLFKFYVDKQDLKMEIELKITQNPELAELVRENIKKKIGGAK
ncbi:MAG TPA: hypothetical protein VJI52_04870 [Candidatus Nanoarchaeia archaeon]|nr:hypothetical protein [Candidatus Nanoarchaeia archaeon]